MKQPVLSNTEDAGDTLGSAHAQRVRRAFQTPQDGHTRGVTPCGMATLPAVHAPLALHPDTRPGTWDLADASNVKATARIPPAGRCGLSHLSYKIL